MAEWRNWWHAFLGRDDVTVFLELEDQIDRDLVRMDRKVIVAGLVFVGSWIYAISAYGWFLGLSLGWIPSLILAMFAAALWPGWPIYVFAILAIVVWLLS